MRHPFARVYRLLVGILGLLLLTAATTACQQSDLPAPQGGASPTAVEAAAASPLSAAVPASPTPPSIAAPAGTAAAAGRAAPTAIDPCQVASKQELEVVAGVPLGDGMLTRSVVDVCMYEEVAGRRVVPALVYLVAMRSPNVHEFFEDAHRQASPATDVADLGDQAFFDAGHALTVVQGQVLLQLDIDNRPTGLSDAEFRGRLLDLMRLMLRRV